MPPLNDATPFLRHIETHNRHDPSRYRPLLAHGMEVGLVRHDHCDALARHPDLVSITGESLALAEASTPEALSRLFAQLGQSMADQGFFKLRGELYPVVTEWGATPLATIDRGATVFFGTRSFGVHVNGIVTRADGLHLWIGHRSMDRGVAPGKLDNMIGGGLTAGLTAWETLIKEAHEEAGIGKAIAEKAVPIGMIAYTHDTSTGIKRDMLFGYDLHMAEDMVPANQDGEVARFELMPVLQVAELVRDTDQFKSNCNLVIIDLLIRHGYLTPDMPGYARLVMGLRRFRTPADF